MKLKEIVGACAQFIFKAAMFGFIILYVFRLAVAAYDYGFRVFAEEPVATGEGRTISVYIEDNESVKDVGKMLEEKGLIRDGKLFIVQELLSEHHGKIQPGIYDLNTTMTAQEMLAVIAQEPAAEEDEE